MGWQFCKTLSQFADNLSWRDALREAEERVTNNNNPTSTSVLNPLTKAANAGSLAMQMQFEPLEGKSGSLGNNNAHSFVLVAGSLSTK